VKTGLHYLINNSIFNNIDTKKIVNYMKTSNLPKYLIAAMVIVLASCSANKPTESDAKAEENSKVLVKTSKIESRAIEQEIDFTGNVNAFRQNHISSNSPSRISKIFVEVGDFVKEGQLLVQMDNTNFSQIKTQLDNLEKEYARLDTLNRVGSVSQQQVDQVKTQLNVLRTTFKNLSENTQLLSPIDGIITGRYYNDGEMYSMAPSVTGKPAIVSVMQIQPVKVMVNVPEMYFPNVKLGLESTITMDIYPKREFKGKVYLIYPTVDPLTRTFSVEVEIPNPNLLLRPGMFARVKFGFGKMDRVVVPDVAVLRQTGTNDRYVFVVEDKVAIRKTVTLGRRIDDYFEVLTGLTVNEQVVVAGQSRLLEGTSVEIED
jgi:RND family efflux transporter MFP subunit